MKDVEIEDLCSIWFSDLQSSPQALWEPSCRTLCRYAPAQSRLDRPWWPRPRRVLQVLLGVPLNAQGEAFRMARSHHACQTSCTDSHEVWLVAQAVVDEVVHRPMSVPCRRWCLMSAGILLSRLLVYFVYLLTN